MVVECSPIKPEIKVLSQARACCLEITARVKPILREIKNRKHHCFQRITSRANQETTPRTEQLTHLLQTMQEECSQIMLIKRKRKVALCSVVRQLLVREVKKRIYLEIIQPLGARLRINRRRLVVCLAATTRLLR
mgnify:CR=1 FL=1